MDVHMYDAGYRLKQQQSFVNSLNFIIHVGFRGHRWKCIMAFIYNDISVDDIAGKIPAINSPFTDLVTRAEKASAIFIKILD